MIHLGDIPTVWHIVWDATFTFVALIIISLLLDEAGFFHWAALHIARWGGGGAGGCSRWWCCSGPRSRPSSPTTARPCC